MQCLLLWTSNRVFLGAHVVPCLPVSKAKQTRHLFLMRVNTISKAFSYSYHIFKAICIRGSIVLRKTNQQKMNGSEAVGFEIARYRRSLSKFFTDLLCWLDIACSMKVQHHVDQQHGRWVPDLPYKLQFEDHLLHLQVIYCCKVWELSARSFLPALNELGIDVARLMSKIETIICSLSIIGWHKLWKWTGVYWTRSST